MQKAHAAAACPVPSREFTSNKAIRTRSAVAIIRVDTNDNREYLILKRAPHPLDPWSGHLAFPGGRFEKNQDQNLLETAIRETMEECGIHLSPAVRHQQLPDSYAGAWTHSLIGVRPYVFYLPQKPAITLEPREVSDFCWVTSSYLHQISHHALRPMVPQKPQVLFASMQLEIGILWGFTYQLLHTLEQWPLPK